MGRTLRIGISFWGFLKHPSDHTEVETPDGLRGERAFFVDELLTRGHTVIQLQKRREAWGYSCVRQSDGCEFFVHDDETGFPDLDVLFVEWRWRIPHKDSADWDRQCALLDHYSRAGTPIIVQDTDLKITADDEARWPSMVIGDPCLRPKALTRSRIQMPFCNVFVQPSSPPEDVVRYTYVGNNYERQEQFERYYAEPAEQLRVAGIQTTVHGNWLTKSPERMHPRAIVQQYKHVAFAPRLAYRDVHGILVSSLVVCHITKSEYARHGNITVRYFEALTAGVPALIPVESALMRDVGDSAGLMVGRPSDVIRKVSNLANMTAEERRILVRSQENALKCLADFSPGHKADLVEAVARKEIVA